MSADHAAAFRALHSTAEPLRLLNAWDAGSAKVLAAAGAPAIATTSAGIAGALGLPDGEQLTRDTMLGIVRSMVAAVDVPVSADLEAGYGDVAETVRLAVEAGVIGFNLEDGIGDGKLRPLDEQLQLLADARSAIAASGVPAFLNARVDAIWISLGADVAAERARAYAEAGADGIFVPGAKDPNMIGVLAEASAPAAFNILAVPDLPPLAELGSLGVARVSTGSGPARAALSLLNTIAHDVLDDGSFTSATSAQLSWHDINTMMNGGTAG